MMHDFHVGMKVVCVDDGEGLYKCKCVIAKRGEVYTICALFLARDETRGIDEQVVCRLTELKNEHEHYWGLWRFRPLEEKPDAIEVFRQIARDVSAGKVRKMEDA